MTFISDNKDIENKAGFVSQYQKLTKLSELELCESKLMTEIRTYGSLD